MAPLDRRQFVRAFGTATAGVVAGCLGDGSNADDGATGSLDDAPRHDWPMHGYDAANTGHHPDTTGPDGPVSAQWTLDARLQTTPAVVDGTIYGSDPDENLAAIDAVDGSVEWQYETRSGLHYSIAAVDGVVYAIDGSGTLYAVDAAEGAELWTESFAGEGGLSPTVVDAATAAESASAGSDSGTVFSGSFASPLWALDAESGDRRWPLEGLRDPDAVPADAPPAVVDGTLYASAEDGVVHAVDATDGTERWQTQVGDGSELWTAPTVVGGTVYVGHRHDGVYALDAASGEERWASDEQMSPSGLAVANGRVYVTDDARLFAFDADTGETDWQATAKGWSFTAPVVADGTVYHASASGTVFAVDAETGDVEWTFETRPPDRQPAPPVVVDGVVFYAGLTGFYALTSDED